MAEPPLPTPDALALLRDATSARVGLGRVGQSLPTAPMLAFQLAHAKAQDAVHAALDLDRLTEALDGPWLSLQSQAKDRTSYLQDPDLGRRLGADGPRLEKGNYDLALVLADGLSAAALHAQAPLVVDGLKRRLGDLRLAPLLIATQARVAIGDPIGEQLGAKLVVVLIGERPGLSAWDSLSAYLTFDPKPGRRDSERNCVSNIRKDGGLTPDQGAGKIAWLVREALRLGFSGVDLKDREEALAPPDMPPLLP